MKWVQHAWIVGLVEVLSCLGCAADDSRLQHAMTRIHELEEENTALREGNEVLRERLETIVAMVDCSTTVCPSYPPIDALVLEVDPSRKLVVLDKGRQDSVEVGYVFSVYRGSTFKGQVRVTEVSERTCSCVIVHVKNPIAAGDSATTCL